MFRKKKLPIILTLTVFLGLSFAIAGAQTNTEAERSALIQKLMKQIQELITEIQRIQEQVVNLSGEPTAEPVTTPTETLEPPIQAAAFGTRNDNIGKLQEFLIDNGYLKEIFAPTRYFGKFTREAMRSFQRDNELLPTGIPDSETLKIINQKRGLKTVIPGLIEEGAGASGKIPSGLLKAPGIQKNLTGTPTPTPGPSATSTPTPSPSATTTPSPTPTPTPESGGGSGSGSGSSGGGSPSPTPTLTPSPSPSATTTPSPTPTPTPSPSPSPSPSPTPSPSPSPTPSLPPSITVITPNGGEMWTAAQTYTVQWNAQNIPPETRVGLQLQSRYSGNPTPYEGGVLYYPSTGTCCGSVSLDPASGSYEWFIPPQYGSGYEQNMFNMRAYLFGPNIPGSPAPTDYSDSTFTISSGGGSLPNTPSSNIASRNNLKILASILDALFKIVTQLQTLIQ